MAEVAYITKKPFVLYSLPSSNLLNASFQKNNALFTSKKLTEDAFVLAPFNFEANAAIIPYAECENFSVEIDTFNNDFKDIVPFEAIEIEKLTHIKIVEKAIETIKNTDNSKIVISRKKEISLQNFEVQKLMTTLFSVYSETFRYIWFHPETGLWCAATPETLVKVEGNNFKTMSLAGTQKARNEKVIWGQKEIEEQLLVTETVTKNLKTIISNLNISQPYNQTAGSLVHIRTDISGEISEDSPLSKIVKAIHPTPAICGVARQFAKHFILKNENYEREFYTGFVGLINGNNIKTDLYVNLRCMKVDNNIATLYAGGGITAASHAEDEWNETQNKLQTMAQLIQEFL